MKRKVCVVTGSRADYGHLRPLIKAIAREKNFTLQLVATGMHLSKDFGMTYREIEKDGFKITQKVAVDLKIDTPAGISHSMSVGIEKFAKVYQAIRPDLVVVLGDRFEILSAVIPAYIARIPIAHLHGGEVTEGAFDEGLRHSMTKMSHWHFVATKQYAKRVIQLGEEPNRVFNVGAIGLDNLKSLKLLSSQSLEKILGFRFLERNLLVTFHPVTLEENTASAQMNNLLSALGELKNTLLIFTKSNADTGGRVINAMIDNFVKKHPQTSRAFVSMGQLKYWSTMCYVDGVVGNSSSGLLEAPSFKVGTVNIGDRQRGRVKADSVIDCLPSKKAIQSAIAKLYSPNFQKKLRNVKNPYGSGSSAPKIIKVLKRKQLVDIKKCFYDV